METEVWPNAVAQCVQYKVPVVLVNARLSERSLRKAQRLESLMQPAAEQLTAVAAQTAGDALRLREFGAPHVEVTGSIKFDVTPPDAMLARGAALRAQIGTRPVLLCASTREGEEALILDALAKLDVPDVLLLIVPRHPQRFDEVTRMVMSRGLTVQKRSMLGDTVLSSTMQVLVGDSMGEMFAYYAACDVAFVGGSLLPLGGQNLIEPCSLGKPVLIGRHTFNFAEVTEEAIAAGAAIRVKDGLDLMRQAHVLLLDASERSLRGEQALGFAQRHRGATSRTMAILRGVLA
jgi:3-deoxy-D-manno-octulosonic-acid transferase